jgi:glycine dehydrogenase subunit 1
MERIMGYIVHTDADRRTLLDAVGLPDVEALFSAIPAELRRYGLDLPQGISEAEAQARIESMAAADRPADTHSFLGAGCYRHFVPAVVRALTSRGEFATAYTPYQPEVSQGTLQHIFEFQTSMCELTGLDVANASLYDGPSALAEAAFMAARLTERRRIAVSAGIHPEAVRVVSTYGAGSCLEIDRLPLDTDRGTTITIGHSLPTDTGALLVQQPNCLGVIEDLEVLAGMAHSAGALLVVLVNPATLGLLEAPGYLGADIAVGDVQVFGSSPCFGGPSAGFLACKADYVRQVPGRLVGQTVDAEGRVCYVLTLQAREQHIRRARATSNVCSNQALSALAATIHLALLGPRGLRQRGEICLSRAHYLHEALCRIPGIEPFVSGPFFHEFALTLPCPATDFAAAMRARGVDPGVPLSRMELGNLPVMETGTGGAAEHAPRAAPRTSDNVILVAVTEINPPEALEHYVVAARDVVAATGASALTGGPG